MRRFITLFAATVSAAVVLLSGANPAAACAGLIGSNGAVNLGRTTTLAAYHDGVEHYVTAFQFLGGGGQFGTLIPLPAIPSNVERGGAWTIDPLTILFAAIWQRGGIQANAMARAACDLIRLRA